MEENWIREEDNRFGTDTFGSEKPRKGSERNSHEVNGQDLEK